ncbi:MAG: polyphosphate polymerase domain-containing protein [Clostridium sp.]|nr:polyphosphate polymerase domain-containing protein [Clostridium sp.]
MNKELTTLRKEIKYTVPLWKALIIKDSLDSLLVKDKYCTNGSYSVRSLYFESVNNIDFSDKLAGTEFRKKVRIRIYNGIESLCKLELKQKKGDWQHKQSFVISAADVKELIDGNYSVLKKYFYNINVAIKAYNFMKQGVYKPVVLIEYDRFAYQYPMFDTRITLDMNIRSTESNLNIFEPKIIYTPIMDEVILEVKYSGKLMGFISDALARFGLTQSACSKYCAGRRIYYDFNY